MNIRRMNVVLFHEVLKAEFNLKFPVQIVFKKDGIVLDGVECFGTWTFENNVHIIELDGIITGIPHCLFAIMAHEYTHAWQWENGALGLVKNSHGKKSGFLDVKRNFKKFYNVDIVTMLPDGMTL